MNPAGGCNELTGMNDFFTMGCSDLTGMNDISAENGPKIVHTRQYITFFC